MTDWRPGLPSEPCVCEIRRPGVGVQFARVVLPNPNVEIEIDGERVEPSAEPMAFVELGRENFSEMVAAHSGVEWRPIPTPEGVDA